MSISPSQQRIPTEQILPRPDRAWIFQLTPPERNTLIATFGGWALDGMDVMAYTFVIPSLITAWHISKGQAGLLASGALLVSTSMAFTWPKSAPSPYIPAPRAWEQARALSKRFSP